MARARNIKPSFFTNEQLVELPFSTRLLFVGLWCLADREGRLEDRPKRIKMAIFPGDEVNVEKAVCDLNEVGFIQRYDVDGEKFIQVLNFVKHQRPHHMEVASVIPPAPGMANRYNHEPIRKEQRQRILDRDGRKCVECESQEDLEIDHIKPVSKGGGSDDSNLRTLCERCNSAKGNRTARGVDACLGSHKEAVHGHSGAHCESVDGGSKRSDTGYRIPEKAKGSDEPSSEPAVPDCPHDAILALYAKHLPMLTQPRLWEGKRAEALRSRWRACAKKNAVWPGYATQEGGLEFWDKFFAGVASARVLTEGIKRPDGSYWKPDLPWLLKAENFFKVIDGKYHQ